MPSRYEIARNNLHTLKPLAIPVTCFLIGMGFGLLPPLFLDDKKPKEAATINDLFWVGAGFTCLSLLSLLAICIKDCCFTPVISGEPTRTDDMTPRGIGVEEGRAIV